MTKRVNEEGFFWDTYPWVTNNVGGIDEKLAGGKKLNSGLSNNHNKMKQSEIRFIGGLGGGDEEVSTTLGGGRKRNGGALEMTNENNTKVGIDHGKKEKGHIESNDHDTHILTERERRKKMRGMFHHLHSLLPQIPPKADKATIVDEAVTYIKTLEETLQKLETQKLHRLQGVSISANIPSLIQPQKLALDTRESFLADQGSSTNHFGIVSRACSTAFSFPWSSPTIFQTWISSNVILNVCGLEAHISICSNSRPGLLTAICFVMEKHKLEIVSATMSTNQAKILFAIHARANVPHEFVEAFPYDEVYKQAATEIMLWVDSRAT